MLHLMSGKKIQKKIATGQRYSIDFIRMENVTVRELRQEIDV